MFGIQTQQMAFRKQSRATTCGNCFLFALIPAFHGEFAPAFTVRFDITTQVMC
jgi:hypothetical protein